MNSTQSIGKLSIYGSAFTGIGILAGVYMARKYGGGFWRYAGFIILGLIASGILYRLLFASRIAAAVIPPAQDPTISAGTQSGSGSLDAN